MAQLDYTEENEVKRFFNDGGYVFDFNDRNFSQFVKKVTRLDIDDLKYRSAGGSKGKRLLEFIKVEDDRTVGKLLSELLKYHEAMHRVNPEKFCQNFGLRDSCRRIAEKLLSQSESMHIDHLSLADVNDEFYDLCGVIRSEVEQGKPEACLDRLHVLLIKHITYLLKDLGVSDTNEKPIYSLFGEYVKKLEKSKIIDNELTLTILKANISVYTKFNEVRNHRSYAHDNPLLNQADALYVVDSMILVKKYIYYLHPLLKEILRSANSINT